MNGVLNIAISVIFIVLAVMMFIRWGKVKDKIMIRDRQWSIMRMLFVFIGLMTLITLVTNPQQNTILDYVRIVATILAVSAYVLAHDGIGEEGIVVGGKLIPWKHVRGWDMQQDKKVLNYFFEVDSMNEKKPDDYQLKELDFSSDDKEILKTFMDTNVRGKKMRMKKKRK
jgi:hypothetical protein